MGVADHGPGQGDTLALAARQLAGPAVQQLVDEQVLYKKRGIGMFVSPTARDALRAQRRETFYSDVVDPMVAEAKAVGIPIDEVVARIQQLDGRAGR